MAVTLHAHTMSAVLSGNRGAVGVGIADITFNDDYTMTITLTDGSTYTSGNLRGAQGIPGIDAEYDGEELVITTGDHTETDGGEVSTIRVKGEARTIRDRVTEEMACSAYPTETASGDIVSITDGAEDIPVKALTVAVEPVQDLHGQDAPYPAGGGKNLFDASKIVRAHNGITASVASDGTITLNGTAGSGNSYFNVSGIGAESTTGFSWSANNPVANTGVHVVLRDAGGGYFGDGNLGTVNKTNSLPTATNLNGVNIYVKEGTQLTNFVLKPQVEKGGTPTSYAPYSNICPITGWDAVNVVRCGKNLCADTLLNGQVGSNGGYASASNRVTNVTSNNALPQTHLPAGTYTISASGLDYVTVLTKDASKNIVDNFASSWHTLPFTFTLTADGYVLFTLRKSDNSDLSPSAFSVQIEAGSTATAYEQYIAPTTYPIPLPSTVYGGTLDVATGVMTVDRAIITPNVYAKQSVNDNGIANYSFSVSSVGAADDSRRLESISNILPYGTNSISSETRPSFIIANAGTGYIRLRNSEVDTAEKANTWISNNGLYIVYCLNTKTTITLDPVTISTLLGNNTLYADAGQVSVAYRADVGLYIDKRIAEVQALVLES